MSDNKTLTQEQLAERLAGMDLETAKKFRDRFYDMVWLSIDRQEQARAIAAIVFGTEVKDG